MRGADIHLKTLPAIACALLLCAQTAEKLHYPRAPQGNQVDDYHGVKIADPYRSLEDADAPSTRQFVEEENKLTRGWLDRLPGHAEINKQLTQLWNYEKFNGPFKAGNHYFYFHNTGLQNQSVMYVMPSLDGPARVLIDPNTYRKDGTAALSGTVPSWNGELLAYGVEQAGSDWEEWRVRDVATGQDHSDLIRWCKGASIAWTPDDRGFYYSRFPEPPPDKVLTVAALGQKVYFHKLGDPQQADRLVYERPEHPSWGLYSTLLEDSSYLVFTIYTGVEGTNLLSYEDLSAGHPRIADLVTKAEYLYNPIAAVGSTLYLHTNDSAPRSRVIAIDLTHPDRADWKEIVPESDATLEGAEMADGKLLLTYLKDAHAAASVFSLEGQHIADVALPGIGAAYWSPVRLGDREMFYQFTNFATPPSVYKLDLTTATSTLYRPSNAAWNAAEYETRQIFYNSKDGTRVPMFISFKKGLKLDGQNPVLLYAYGGFDIAVTPSFNPMVALWMQMGGVYAVPNIRGGSEYGEAWHKAGMRANKQNVFDDFIAAAEWLIANKYTSAPKLAIFGGSNGGLLIGAVLNQRPDLFGAAMPAVGVMDMLRFQKFGFGTQWVGEYGSPDDPEDFKVIRKYSPLHNIRKGVRYPPTLITTGDHDDRVMPGHSLKYAATLQQAQAGPAPILIRIETRAGHGGGKPTSKQIEESVDRLVFLRATLGMNARAQ